MDKKIEIYVQDHKCTAQKCEGRASYLVKYSKVVKTCSSCRPVNRPYCAYHAERYARLNSLELPIRGETVVAQGTVGGEV